MIERRKALKMINRQKLLDRPYNQRDARLFVIATEGKKTEKAYFEGLFFDSRIKIEILPTGDNNQSSPKHVIERLNTFKDRYDLREDDTLWLVIDVDNWKPKNLSEVCREAKQKGYRLAISNPCFEVWLYLHVSDLDPQDFNGIGSENLKCELIEKRLRLILGSYSKAKLDIEPYKNTIRDAINRAKSMHKNASQNWPPTIGSHVYRVVEMILKYLK
jgi:hypothetical protein